MEATKQERKPPVRGRRKKLQRIVQTGRTGLLAILVASLINQLLLLLDIKYFFLFGASAPYYLNWLGQELSLYHEVAAYRVIAVMLTFGVYLVYVSCWFMSAKSWKHMKAALVLYCADTLFMIIFALAFLMNPLSCILWFFVHLVGIGVLYRAFRAAQKLESEKRRKTVPKEV